MTLTTQEQSELKELLGPDWMKKAQEALNDLATGRYATFEHVIGGLGVYQQWQSMRQSRQEKKRQPFEAEKPRRTTQALRVLGLEPGATQKEIRARYRTLARKNHPDTPNGDVERMKALNAAYAVLKGK